MIIEILGKDEEWIWGTAESEFGKDIFHISHDEFKALSSRADVIGIIGLGDK